MPTNSVSVKKALDSCFQQAPKLKSAIESNPGPIEEPSKTASISIDDVGVKKQKEHRVPAYIQSQKYVHKPKVHIEHEQGSYWRYGHGVTNVLRLSLALGRNNELLKNNLRIEVDGQKTLFDTIIKAFLWVSKIQIILDW